MKANFLFFILLLSTLTLSLSEYGFLLEPKPLSFSYYTIYPRSCAGFLNADDALAQNARSDFAFEKASQSIRDLRKAKAFAFLQPKFLNSATLAAYRQYSVYCFLYGQKALREASEATREGLEIIDSDSAKLGRMTGLDFEGFAGGVLKELGEAKSVIEKRDSAGKGFGSEFVKTIPLVNSTLTSQAIANAVRALIGTGGLMEKEIVLDDKVLQGIYLLEREFQQAGEENELAKIRVKLSREFLEGEKIKSVGENAFYLIGGGSSISAEYSLGSFEEDFRNAAELEKTALEKAEDAKQDWKNQEPGFATRAISKMGEANANLAKAEGIFSGMNERSNVLEKSLRERVLAEKNTVERMLLTANSFAAARARAVLQKILSSSPLPTRGERIAYYAVKITELQDLQEILGEKVETDALRATVESKASVLGEFIRRAAADTTVDFEERRLKEIELSLENAKAEDYAFFNSELNDLKESVNARLLQEYAGLEDDYAKAKALAGFLGESEQTKVLQYEGFFEGGILDVEKAAGSLKKIQNALKQTLALAEVKTPSILKKHLQEQAQVERIPDVPIVGRKTAVKHKITLRNLLPLGYGKQLQLDFEIPEGARVLQKTPEVITGKNLFLGKVEEGGIYSIEFETEEEIAVLEKSQLKTVFADLLEARVEEKIIFTSTEDSEVLLLLSKPFPVEFAEADSGKTVFFSNATEADVRVLLPAQKGSNQVVLTYLIPSPVSLTRSFTVLGNSSEFQFEAESRFLDLQDFESEIIEEGCFGKAKADGELEAKAVMENGVLAVQLKSKELKRFEKKTARITLECIPSVPLGLSVEAETPFFGVEFDFKKAEMLWKEIEEIERVCEECVFEAKKQFLLGDLKQAEAETEKARVKALEAQEEKLEEGNAFEKLSLEFQEFKSTALDSIQEFDVAFSPTQENSWELGKSVLNQQGKKIKADLEKLLNTGEKAKTSAQLNSTLKQALTKQQSLEQVVLQQREKARQEITSA
ncbi:MAG: hypothetical protein V1717_01695, partial [Candidatus Micrarchaeota archaeon]